MKWQGRGGMVSPARAIGADSAPVIGEDHHMSQVNGDATPTTTFDSGIPAPAEDYSLTAGPDGPIVLHDAYVVQKMQQFNRERVPERVVHAKGTGAHGYFTVTNDITEYTVAKLFSEVGKRTEIFARFSQVAGEHGYADTVRDPRGFSVKFYTEEGNWDLVGNNTPVFFMRDPAKFQSFIRSQKRLPDSGLRSNDMQWDFWTRSPESAHQVMILMSDHGTPASYASMNGYGSHTFSMENADGEKVWVKYHFIADGGQHDFTNDEADAHAGPDPDFLRRDLRDRIARGPHPSWTLKIQVMPFQDAPRYRFNPFDVTKVWPHADYPLIEVGTMVLDRNPDNFFAEVEQSAFSPSNLVPGLGLSPDKMLQGRIFSYHDTHLHRIGKNYQQLPINAPRVAVHSYNKDGSMTYDYPVGQPVYSPNSYGGPVSDPQRGHDLTWATQGGEIGRFAYTAHAEDDDFGQAGTLYRTVLSDQGREHTVTNILGHVGDGVSPTIQRRAVEYLSKIDADLGVAVAKGLAIAGGARPAGADEPEPFGLAASEGPTLGTREPETVGRT